MRTFVTDRRTDGADYIGPEAGPKMTELYFFLRPKNFGLHCRFFSDAGEKIFNRWDKISSMEMKLGLFDILSTSTLQISSYLDLR